MAREPSQKLAGTVLLRGSLSSPPLRLNWLAGSGPQEFGSSETHFSPSGILKERCVLILFCLLCFKIHELLALNLQITFRAGCGAPAYVPFARFRVHIERNAWNPLRWNLGVRDYATFPELTSFLVLNQKSESGLCTGHAFFICPFDSVKGFDGL